MHLLPPPDRRRPDPPPMQVDVATVVKVGMAVWAVLLVAATARRDELVSQGRGWWIWTAVAGIVLGLWGLALVRRRDHR